MPKDTIIQKNNFTKQYGTLRPNMLDTVKEKEYYLEQQGNSFSLQFPLRFQMTSDAVLLLCTKLFIDNAKSQILLTDITYDNLGRRIYCYGQYYNGIRVRGGHLKMYENSFGIISNSNGRIVSGLQNYETSLISPEEAQLSIINNLKIKYKEGFSDSDNYIFGVSELTASHV